MNIIQAICTALKQIEDAEKVQDQARNVRDYDRAKNESANATIDAMHALKEAVRLTSVIGFSYLLHRIFNLFSVIACQSLHIVYLLIVITSFLTIQRQRKLY